MNPYCIFDLCADLVIAKAIRVAALSRSHAAGLASTSLVLDAKTCPTRKTFQQPVVAPALAGVLATMTTVDILGIAAILFHLTILAGLDALSRSTKNSSVGRL